MLFTTNVMIWLIDSLSQFNWPPAGPAVVAWWYDNDTEGDVQNSLCAPVLFGRPYHVPPSLWIPRLDASSLPSPPPSPTWPLRTLTRAISPRERQRERKEGGEGKRETGRKRKKKMCMMSGWMKGWISDEWMNEWMNNWLSKWKWM